MKKRYLILPIFVAVSTLIFILALVFLLYLGAEHQPDFARIEQVPGIDNFARVTPDIWRGEAPDEEGLNWLKESGVKTIIDFRTRSEHEGLRDDPRIKYIQLPFSATDAPPKEVVEKFFETITDPASQPVYFHCRYGKDRTGAFAALYRIKVQGWDTAKAVKEMKYFGYRSIYRDLIGYVRSQKPGKPAQGAD